jgi:succinate-semialdehyde dehydrogenase/glutarate-semialdehyde dehydrogenase
VVLKPAEQTPFTAIKLLEIMLEAGVPAGVVNLVMAEDPRPIGAELLENPLVRKITFTGSTEVGKYLAQESAKHVKHVSLELGGHAPFIVFEDADLEAAAKGAIASKFRNAGQTCVCANRIYVHENVLEQFLEHFTPLVNVLRVGDGLESGVQIGPLIDEQGLQKVEAQVLEAVGAGAKVVAGGAKPQGLNGHFYQPTVLIGVRDDMRVMYEETFGPVAPVVTFKTDAEVLARANHGPFGLAAYYYTQNLSRAWKIAEGLEYGIIGCNDAIPSTAQAPFGGYKESGTGREGGSEGIEAFLETKYVSMGI